MSRRNSCQRFKPLLVSAVLMLAASVSAWGEVTDSSRTEIIRPVMSAYTFEAGGSHLADTYLTPLIYGGYSLALQYERWQAMKFSPDRWVMSLTVRGTWNDADSPARNNSMWYAGLDARWAMLHRWRLLGASLPERAVPQALWPDACTMVATAIILPRQRCRGRSMLQRMPRGRHGSDGCL